MGSLDIDSLFTKMLLEKTIANCTNNLFKNSKIVYGLKKKKKKIYRSSIFSNQRVEPNFIFNNTLCKQIDGRAMRSQLIGNAFWINRSKIVV